MKSEIPTAPAGDITPDTAGAWLSMVAQVTGYGVTLNDAQRGKIDTRSALAQPGLALAGIQVAGRHIVMTFQDQETSGIALWASRT